MKNNYKYTTKLAWAMIVKADKIESELLNRCLSYLDGLINKFFITITFTSKTKKLEIKTVKKIAEKYGSEISLFNWTNDFAEARNFNFNQVPKEYEYIGWCDADDVVKNADLLKKYANKMKNENIDGLVFDYLFGFDQYGYCNVRHKKTRLIRNDGTYKWHGRGIHEDLVANRGVAQFWVKDVEFLHIKNYDETSISPEKQESLIKRTIERNLEIAQAYYENHKKEKDPRDLYNLGNAYFGDQKWIESIKYFIKFLDLSHSNAEKYLAWLRIGDCYFNLRDYQSAENAYVECYRLKPWVPDGYLALARTYFIQGKIKHSKETILEGIRKASTKEYQQDMIVWNPREYDLQARELLAKVYFKLSEPEMSYKIIKSLSGTFPKNKELKEQTKELKEILDELGVVDKYVDEVIKMKNKTKEKVKRVLAKIPLNLRSHPKILIIQNSFLRKVKTSGKDLAIYCGKQSFEWNPNTAETGIGGSEEAVINMAPLLQKLGWKVTVYNECGVRGYECSSGVIWRPWWEFNLQDKWDIVIGWRHPQIASLATENWSKLYVWLHDVLPAAEFTPDRLKTITKIIPLSNFHRSLLPNVPDNKIFLSTNGLEPNHFNQKIKRNPYKLIYTSAPDRGLEVLARNIFTIIKKAVPQVELHWFYGWHTFITIQKDDDKQIRWAESLKKYLKNTEGIFDQGRIGHKALARELLNSAVWIYPTMFPEISCISAMKAQYAGCLPIVNCMCNSPIGLVKSAVEETVVAGVKTYFGNLYLDKNQQQKFAELVIKNLKENNNKIEVRDKIPTWQKVAGSWDKEFSKK